MTGTRGRPAPDTEGGPEFQQPGQRSGEGASELSRYLRRDERRRAGIEPQATEDAAADPGQPPPSGQA